MHLLNFNVRFRVRHVTGLHLIMQILLMFIQLLMRIDLPLDRLLLVLDQLGRGLLVSLQDLLTVNFRVRILTDNWAVVI